MSLYEDQFAEKYDFPRVERPTKTLIIASTGRSGSHMLGHALHETKCFGFPLEYLNPGNLLEWKRRLGVRKTKAVLEELQRRRTSPNGVFGIKLHYAHIQQIGGFSEVRKYFPDAYYILLSRVDQLSQAVSMSVARQTGLWIANQNVSPRCTPKYSFKQIDKCLRQIILENASWRYLLASQGCRHKEIIFENARDNLRETIIEIAEFMSIDIGEETLPESQVTIKQGRDFNTVWTKRFSSEFSGSKELCKRAVHKNQILIGIKVLAIKALRVFT